MAMKLTADEIEATGKAVLMPGLKVWSDEARAAALQARRNRAGTGETRALARTRLLESRSGGKKPGVSQSTGTDARVLSAHDTARNLSSQLDQSSGNHSAVTVRASNASSRAFAASHSSEGMYGGVNITAAARDAHEAAATAHSVAASALRTPGNMSNIILSRRHDALSQAHSRVVTAIDSQLKKPK